jgi:prophage DNA circulation protein
MTHDEYIEAVAVLTVVTEALSATLSGQKGLAQWPARTAIGATLASAPSAIPNGQLGARLGNCFDLCRQAGATRVAMDAVIQAVLGIGTFTGIPAVAIALGAIYLALAQEVKIVLAMQFTSREDVDAMMTTMNAAFEAPEEFAADAIEDPSVYQAVVAGHASLMQYLVAQARPLPRMVEYRFNRRMPSLLLAQRLYQDPSRADELVAENHVVHPAFCLAAGRCLST